MSASAVILRSSERRTSGSSKKPGEAAIGGEHLGVRKVRVAAARIRENEEPRPFERLALQAELHTITPLHVEQHAIERHPHERDDARPPASDFPSKHHRAGG